MSFTPTSGIFPRLPSCVPFAAVALLSLVACGDAPSGRDLNRSDFEPDADITCSGVLCGEGEVCARDRCTLACDSDANCLRGDRCTVAGYCYPVVPTGEAQLCILDSDCDSLVCEGGECLAARDCEGDGDCLDNEICAESGFCVSDGAEAVAECTINDDCDDELARCEDGQCTLFDICESDGDCYEGDYCHRGQCRALCADDSDCRGEQTCIGDRCLDAPGDTACRSSDECEPCESCIFGVCTVSEFFCRIDEDCGFDKSCRNGFCAFYCDAGTDCPRGQLCIDGVCLDDAPSDQECVFNDECEGDFVCINARCHTECATHSECGEREMCDHGVCQPDRRPGAECLHNTHCAVYDSTAECVDGHCALPCFGAQECVTLACELGFCTR